MLDCHWTAEQQPQQLVHLHSRRRPLGPEAGQSGICKADDQHRERLAVNALHTKQSGVDGADVFSLVWSPAPASLHWREQWPIPPFSSRARWTDSRLVGRGTLVPLGGRSIRPWGLSLLGIWLCRTICATNQPPRPALRLLLDPGTYRFRPEAAAPFKCTWPKHKSTRPSRHLPRTCLSTNAIKQDTLFSSLNTAHTHKPFRILTHHLIAESRLYSSFTMQRP